MATTTNPYTRKATFKVTTTKQGRVFAGVNKPSKRVITKVLGLSNRPRKIWPTLTAAQLKATNGKGSYKFYQYTDAGALVPVRF